MSTFPVNPTLSFSSFQFIFNAALKTYERRTMKELLAHPGPRITASRATLCFYPCRTSRTSGRTISSSKMRQNIDDMVQRACNNTIAPLTATYHSRRTRCARLRRAEAVPTGTRVAVDAWPRRGRLGELGSRAPLQPARSMSMREACC
jgi:hypothetical protein